MNSRALKSVINLLEETVVQSEKPEFTCRQLTMVLLCVLNDGMTNKDLAERLDITPGGVTRNFKALGPEGSDCLYKKDDGRIMPNEYVVTEITKILSEFEP